MFDVIQGIWREWWAVFEHMERIHIALVCYLLGGLMAFLAARDWYTSPFVENDETPADAGTSDTGQRKTTIIIIPRARPRSNHDDDINSRAL